MANKKTSVKVVFYKNTGGLNNQPTFPMRGWLYTKGQSLKGISPKTYESVDNLKSELEELLTATGATQYYFTEAEDSSAVLTFSF